MTKEQKQPTQTDLELRAMRRINQILAPLPPAAQLRVLTWALRSNQDNSQAIRSSSPVTHVPFQGHNGDEVRPF